MSRLLVFDPYSTGHHPVYIDRFISRLSSYGAIHQFTFAVHTKTIELLSDKAKRIAQELSCQFVEIDQKSYGRTRSIFGISYAERRILGKVIAQGDYDLVVLFYGDHIVNSLGVFPLPKVQIVALFFRAPILEVSGGSFPVKALQRFKVWVRLLLLRSFLSGSSNNKGLFLDYRMVDSEAMNCELCPEPTICSQLSLEERSEIEAKFLQDDARISVLLAGGIAKRKGTARFLSLLLQQDPQVLRKIRLIIVGELQEVDEGRRVQGLIDQLNQAGGWVVCDFTRIDERTYSYFFDETDIVAVPYIDHFGPSGIVSHAIRAGKCILASDGGWIGETVRQYGYGDTYCSDDPEEFSRALAHVLEGAKDESSEQFRDQFVKFNNDSNFAKVIMGSVEEML